MRQGFYNFMYAILTLGLLIPFQCFELPLAHQLVQRRSCQHEYWIHCCPRGLADIHQSDGGHRLYQDGAPRLGAGGDDGRLQPVPVLLEGGLPLMTPINVTQLVLNTLFIWNDYSTSIILLRKKYSLHPDVGTDHLLQREYDHAERGVCLLHHGHDPDSDPLSVHAEIHCQRHHRWCGQGLIPTVGTGLRKA